MIYRQLLKKNNTLITTSNGVTTIKLTIHENFEKIGVGIMGKVYRGESI